jgi:epsilon-lactone hydrolase
MKNDLALSRQNFEKLGKQYKTANKVKIVGEMINGVNCYWFDNHRTQNNRKIIIYLHGGCFVLGSINSHKALVSHLCSELALPICFIEYRLAPEFPFPNAVFDILKVYESIDRSKEVEEIIFMGDSAGSALSISVISILNHQPTSKLSKLVMLSPWIDLRNNSNSIVENAEIDTVLSKWSLDNYTRLYLNGTTLAESNPIENLFGQFPPTLILVGSSEILLDDSVLAYSTISENQPKTKLKIYDDVSHVWLLDNIKTEASKNAIEEMSKFIS